MEKSNGCPFCQSSDVEIKRRVFSSKVNIKCLSCGAGYVWYNCRRETTDDEFLIQWQELICEYRYGVP